MKKALSALALSVSALAFTSCCGLGSFSLCDKPKPRCSGCTEYVKHKPGCCDTVSDATIKRATAQGWDGSTHIGLVPTMKVIAE